MAKAALAILAFAVVMWVTEAVTYPVSAILILGLMILLLGLSPVQDLSEKLGNPKSGDIILKGSDILERITRLVTLLVVFQPQP